jgi:mono/diheme cytochrome c family protein
MNKGVIVAIAVAGLGLGGVALADAAAGKATFEATCADCHEAKDFAGKPAADLETKIKGISAGTVKHKGKVKVTDAQAKELAAFLSAGK